MKVLTRSLSLLTLASVVLFFASCGGDGGEKASKEKAQFNKLKGKWVLGTAALENVSGTPEQIESNFSLTISGTYNSDSPKGPYIYAVTGTESPSPFKPLGTWEFVSFNSGDSGTIVRTDNDENDLTMVYTITSDGKLDLRFNFEGDGFDGAKKMEVGGGWTFILDKVN